MAHRFRRGAKKRQPEGFDAIEPELDKFEMEMREAVVRLLTSPVQSM